MSAIDSTSSEAVTETTAALADVVARVVKADVEVVEDSRLAVVSQEVEEASQEAAAVASVEVVASVVEAEVANHHLSPAASSLQPIACFAAIWGF